MGDLLPLPVCFISEEERQLPASVCEGRPKFLKSRQAWTMLLIGALNFVRVRHARTKRGGVFKGAPNSIQYEALTKLASAADIICELHPKEVSDYPWVERLSSDGGDVCVARPTTTTKS